MSGNWFGLDLPRDVLNEQRSWDRRHRIAIAVDAGATLDEIAAHTGLAFGVVKTFVKQAWLEQRQRRISPLERHYSLMKPLGITHIPRGTSRALEAMSGRRDWLIP
jgi:HAMP domain-containing protein